MNSKNGNGCVTTPTDPSDPMDPMDPVVPNACPDECGSMPMCAPLAVPYVPYQTGNPKQYSHNEALSNGTLFPGLNLPFHLAVEGGSFEQTPLVELQALDFVITELGHFLDTHPEDSEAFALFQQYVAMEKTARTEYEKTYGPLTRPAAAMYDQYCWFADPWPWNYTENEVS